MGMNIPRYSPDVITGTIILIGQKWFFNYRIQSKDTATCKLTDLRSSNLVPINLGTGMKSFNADVRQDNDYRGKDLTVNIGIVLPLITLLFSLLAYV